MNTYGKVQVYYAGSAPATDPKAIKGATPKEVEAAGLPAVGQEVGGLPLATQFRIVTLRMVESAQSASEESASSLTRFANIEIDPDMRKPASNKVGAYLRVAYWAATAALERQAAAIRAGANWWNKPAAAKAADAFALLNLTDAASAAGISVTSWRVLGVVPGPGVFIDWIARLMARVAAMVPPTPSTDPKEIRQVYDRGIQWLAANGFPDAQAELQRLASLGVRSNRGGWSDALTDTMPQSVKDTFLNDKGKPKGWIKAVAVLGVGAVLAYVATPYVKLGTEVAQAIPRRKNPGKRRRKGARR